MVQLLHVSGQSMKHKWQQRHYRYGILRTSGTVPVFLCDVLLFQRCLKMEQSAEKAADQSTTWVLMHCCCCSLM